MSAPHTRVLATLAIIVMGLAGCATPKPAPAQSGVPPVTSPTPHAAAEPPAMAPPAVRTVPAAGPERRMGPGRALPKVMTPLQTLAAANADARQKPDPGGFVAARQVYAYMPGALFELHASPGFVTTILLEPGERLSDIAAGDTTRWMVTEAETETQSEGRAVVLVKPSATGLRTNLVLITDRRTYLIDAFSHGGETYAAQISWSYPARASEPQGVRPLSFAYRVRTTRGAQPRWAPSRVYDDGRRTWIIFPQSVATSEMPPLFVITPEGAEMTNYRVEGVQMVVDRLFDVAELRLGARRPVVVRIERSGAAPASVRGAHR